MVVFAAGAQAHLRPQHVHQIIVATEQPGVQVTCDIAANIIPNHSANTYRIYGSISCSAIGNLRIRCKPVHRHSLYWHSHAWQFDITRYVTELSITSATISGTNGDSYKTHCEYWRNGSYLGSLESGTATL